MFFIVRFRTIALQLMGKEKVRVEFGWRNLWDMIETIQLTVSFDLQPFDLTEAIRSTCSTPGLRGEQISMGLVGKYVDTLSGGRVRNGCRHHVA